MEILKPAAEKECPMKSEDLKNGYEGEMLRIS